MANTDESPAYLGGKDNTWRKLDLSGNQVFYDISNTVLFASGHQVPLLIGTK